MELFLGEKDLNGGFCQRSRRAQITSEAVVPAGRQRTKVVRKKEGRVTVCPSGAWGEGVGHPKGMSHLFP